MEIDQATLSEDFNLDQNVETFIYGDNKKQRGEEREREKESRGEEIGAQCGR